MKVTITKSTSGGDGNRAQRDLLWWGIFVMGLTLLPYAYASLSLDSLLQEQKLRAGGRWREFQKVLDNPSHFGLVSEEMVEDYRFLLAYLPLSDLAFMSGADLGENIVLAYRARHEFPWGEEIPKDIWKHFVIPHRISQEPYTPWRRVIWEELAPRVYGLDMRQAVLEVNHWCHEWATYKPTDRRDQDPLTTMRSGWGRCEEEMILTIAALRSVGIPARQCFTPYWAHIDDNHAWVEVWVEGRWYYLGASEPAQDLNQAWFSGAVRRAMLVISTAYGDYQGPEPVIKRYRRSTSINSTPVYGPTRVIKVGLLDERGKTLANRRLIFSLFNYGSWMPFLSLMTDSQGWVEWECGQGDFLVTAGEGNWGVAELIKGGDRKVQLILRKKFFTPRSSLLEYCPPPERPTSLGEVISPEGEIRGVISPEEKSEVDSLFRLRLQREDSLRESRVWWWTLGDRVPLAEISAPPDFTSLTELWDYLKEAEITDIEKVVEWLKKARGNWGEIYRFITGHYPFSTPSPEEGDTLVATFHLPLGVKSRVLLLEQLSEKDLRDFTFINLYDHWLNTTYSLGMYEPLFILGYWDSLDEESRLRAAQGIITPRLDDEPSLPWRGEVKRFLSERNYLIWSEKDVNLRKWLTDSLTREEEIDRLGAPLTPAQVLTLRRGTSADIERLYSALCRIRMMPARRNPTTDVWEVWEPKSGWRAFNLFEAKKPSKKPREGRLHLFCASDDTVALQALYMKDFSVALWTGSHFGAMDLGFHRPFSEITFPIDLPVGRYVLISGKRREDGSAPVRMKWFEIKPHKTSRLQLRLSP